MARDDWRRRHIGKRSGGPVDIGELLSRVSRGQMAQGMHRARAVTLWPTVAGAELAKLTRARNTHQGVLWVEADSSALCHMLTMQRVGWVKKLQSALGDASVEDIRFVPAEPKARQREPAAQKKLPPPDMERARELLSGQPLPSELVETALKAASAVERAQRWRSSQTLPPCPVCGVPSKRSSPSEPCLPCRINLQNPLVQRASKELLLSPAAVRRWEEPLGEHGMRAARWLALGNMERQLRELALETIKDAAYRGHLQARAEAYLSLLAGQAVSIEEASEALLALLPEGVRGLL